MKFPDLPKWQMIAVPAMLLCLALFYIARYVVADELIYANDHITALESDLGEALEALEDKNHRVRAAAAVALGAEERSAPVEWTEGWDGRRVRQ